MKKTAIQIAQEVANKLQGVRMGSDISPLIALAEAQRDWQELSWSMLTQACEHEGKIDNMCMSTYEDACDRFERCGWLRNGNGRIYEIVPDGERPQSGT